MKHKLLLFFSILSFAVKAQVDYSREYSMVPDSILHPNLDCPYLNYEPGSGSATINVFVVDSLNENLRIAIDRTNKKQERFDVELDSENRSSFSIEVDGITNVTISLGGNWGRIYPVGGENMDVYVFSPRPNQPSPIVAQTNFVLTSGSYRTNTYILGCPEYLQAMDAEWMCAGSFIKSKMSVKDYIKMAHGIRKGIDNYINTHPDLPQALRQAIEYRRDNAMQSFAENPKGILDYYLPPGIEFDFNTLTPAQKEQVLQVK